MFAWYWIGLLKLIRPTKKIKIGYNTRLTVQLYIDVVMVCTNKDTAYLYKYVAVGGIGSVESKNAWSNA